MKTNTKRNAFKVLDKMRVGRTFSGIELWNSAKDGYCYPATVLRYLREWRSNNKEFDIKLLDKPRSKYVKIRRAL